MHPLHLFTRRGAELDRYEVVSHARPSRPFEDCVEASRTFGMTCAGGVVLNLGMRREQDRHQGESTVEPCEGSREAIPARPAAHQPGLRISPLAQRRPPIGRRAARARSWHPSPDGRGIRAIARQLAEDGYEQAITVALSPTEQEPFRDAGFVLQERLHLLVHHLTAVPPRMTPKPRRARRDDWPAIEQTDAESFSEFWRLGQQGLRQAMAATPVRRMRVIGVDESDQVIAYALTGRAGPTGYLQRLAVRPAHQGDGLGRCLAIDSPALAPAPSLGPGPGEHAGHQRARVQPLPEPGFSPTERLAVLASR